MTHRSARNGSTRRSEKLDLRLSREAKRTLQSATAAAHRSVSEFVLESALARAAETFPDRRRFELEEAQWAEFEHALDAPPRALPRLGKLLTSHRNPKSRRG